MWKPFCRFLSNHVHKIVLLPLESVCIIFFLFHLISYPRTFSTVRNTNGEPGHSYFVPEQRGKVFSVSPSRMTFVESVIEDDFNQSEEILSYSSDLRVLVLNKYWILSNAFSVIIVMSTWFSSFILLIW